MSLTATSFGTKVAIVTLSLVAIGGGAAVAAANGALPAIPASATSTANPEPDETETPTPTASATETPTPSPSATKGPDATGPAAFGLCTAYTAGGLDSGSVAYAALLSASQSDGSIADYCAPILAAHPGADNHGPAQHSNAPVRGESGSDHGNDSPGSHGR
jgi:hypothetical protein